MKKTIIILEHNGGRLGNQLWNHVSVLAYCLERGFNFQNNSFYEYDRFFAMPRPWFAYLPKRVARKFYLRYAAKIKARKAALIIDLDSSAEHRKTALADFETSSAPLAYTTGWLMRDREGIQKFHADITALVSPKTSITRHVAAFMAPLRKKYAHIVGVHIRLGDYKKNPDQSLVFTPEEVRKILVEYTAEFTAKGETCFVICSDEQIDMKAFHGLNAVKGPGSIIEDLFTLASADTILGSNSTFGTFASYYGNIPFIMFEHGQTDWAFYTAKIAEAGGHYFENPKATMTQYQ